MNSHYNPWLEWFKLPNVTQDINPVTSWWSPQIEFNFAGDRQIESKVVSDVASYGKQLGLLSEAILEIAEGKQGDGVNNLKRLVEDIEQIKNEHKNKLEEKVIADLDSLKALDAEALKCILKKYQ